MAAAFGGKADLGFVGRERHVGFPGGAIELLHVGGVAEITLRARPGGDLDVFVARATRAIGHVMKGLAIVGERGAIFARGGGAQATDGDGQGKGVGLRGPFGDIETGKVAIPGGAEKDGSLVVGNPWQVVVGVAVKRGEVFGCDEFSVEGGT